METVKQPSPGLYAAVLHILSSADPRSGSLASTMTDFADQLTTDEAECLPRAIGHVLPLLRADAERLRFAAEIATRLDFFEVTGALTDLATTTGDRQLLLMAATLCGNPAVESSLRNRVSHLVGVDPAGRIRLDRHTVPKTVDETRLYLQCWPGARTNDARFALAPVIVLDSGFDAGAVLRLVISLDSAGAVVRRLVSGVKVPFWFGHQTVLLCGSQTRSHVLSSYPNFPEAHIRTGNLPENERQLSALFVQVNAVLPQPQKLRLAEFSPEIAANLWAPDVFTAGVYQTKDAAFLTGASRSSLNYLRGQKLIRPRASTAIRWTFRDLVAVRTWTYLKSIAQGRVSARVVPELARFAGDSKAVKLGVMSNGKVHVDSGEGWINVETGQRQLEMSITDIDTVFRPFTYGGGRVVSLLYASHNTRLHPTVLHGTPRLKGHRISAKGLAGLYGRGGSAAIISSYPELKNKPFDDTVGIGFRLLGVD